MTTLEPELLLVQPGTRPLHGFAALAAAARPDDPAWLARLRAKAASRFSDVGLPGSKDEEWRFTSLREIAAAKFRLADPSPSLTSDDLEPYLLGSSDWPLLVVVDGRVDGRLSRLVPFAPGPGRPVFGSLGGAIAAGVPLVEQHLARHAPVEATPFTAANAALFSDGAFVHVAAGEVLPHPLHILHVATGAAADAIIAPRTLVVLERGASATVIESYVGIGAPALSDSDRAGIADTARPHLTNACAEIVLADGAQLEHIRLQREAATAWHVGFTSVDQQRDSHYRSFTLALGARLSRHNLHARLGASRVETLLYGLYLGRDEQLLDNHTAIFHDHPDCNSWEVYKGVLADRAHGVFNGKVIVQPAAQKTDAKQTNRNLLLSDHARIDTKPQLEIFADDVKCTHGATVGRLDEQQRYYLRTRGIAGRTAEVMLIYAFVAEVLAEIAQPEIREALEALVHAEMDALIG